MTHGQLERSTPSTCGQCGGAFVAKNRNGKKKEYCSRTCKDRFLNGQRLKGAALLKGKQSPVQRRVKARNRTLDDLAAAEGLPPGCYPPGALGLLKRKRSFVDGLPATQRLALLVEAARRLGLTEEGPTLKAARLAAQVSTPSAFSLQSVEASA